MPWQQIIDPFNNISLSALVALLPISFIFWALIVKKMKGYIAGLLATLIAILIAVLAYTMPVSLALLSAANGALYGLFPICWIIVPAVFLFNLTVKSGRFEDIRQFMADITPDRRIQALLIAFSFGAFLEGTAGFGAPVAITAAMLVGLGFNPVYAAGICLLANTAPVAFGSIGIPITVAAQVSGINEMAISQMVGRTLPFLSMLLPFYLVNIMCGFKKSREVLPAILVSGFTFALLQWLVSNFIGPALPDVIAGLGSILALFLFLKVWKPRQVWKFADEPPHHDEIVPRQKSREIFRALAPFLILTLVIVTWGLQPVKTLLDSFLFFEFPFPGLDQQIANGEGQLISHIFRINTFSAAGTAIFASACVSIPILGLSFRKGLQIFLSTVRQLSFAIVNIMAVLAFAYVLNDSGITLTLAAALAATGFLFPLFAPLLGWLGVFITGSDTSSNALFSKLQASTATSIGVDPVVTVAANVSGGVVGKMISPQSIAVAAAAGNLVGQESSLFRFTVKHSFIMLTLISIFVFAQAYLLKWMIPANTPQHNITEKDSGNFLAWIYLLALVLIIIVITHIAKKARPIKIP